MNAAKLVSREIHTAAVMTAYNGALHSDLQTFHDSSVTQHKLNSFNRTNK